MDPPRHRRPGPWIAPDQRIDFVRGQLVALVAQIHQRLARPLDESEPQVFVGEQPAHHELNRFLRHVAVIRKLRASVRMADQTENRIPAIE